MVEISKVPDCSIWWKYMQEGSHGQRRNRSQMRDQPYVHNKYISQELIYWDLHWSLNEGSHDSVTWSPPTRPHFLMILSPPHHYIEHQFCLWAFGGQTTSKPQHLCDLMKHLGQPGRALICVLQARTTLPLTNVMMLVLLQVMALTEAVCPGGMWLISGSEGERTVPKPLGWNEIIFTKIFLLTTAANMSFFKSRTHNPRNQIAFECNVSKHWDSILCLQDLANS